MRVDGKRERKGIRDMKKGNENNERTRKRRKETEGRGRRVIQGKTQDLEMKKK